MKVLFSLLMLVWAPLSLAQGAAGYVVTTNPVNFGLYRPFANKDRQGRGNIKIACKNLNQNDCNATVQIQFSNETCTDSPYARTMHNVAGDELRYNLYQDTSHLHAFCRTVSLKLGSQNSGSVFPIYGVIPQGQLVSEGVYTDVIQVQISY